MSQLFEVVESVQGNGTEFQILQYRALQNEHLYIQQKIGNRLNQVRILLNEGKIFTEVETFYFLRGNIHIDHKMKNATSKMKKLASTMVKNEAVLKPSYEGTGEVYLTPDLANYMIYRLQDEDIVIDPDMFIAAESTIEISMTINKSLPVAAAKHPEQFTQTKLSGSGIVVFKIPVPADELLEIKLNEDCFQADQQLVVFRSGQIDFTVESTSKSLLSSFTSTDAFIRTYTGTGTLWIAPTQPFYQKPE